MSFQFKNNIVEMAPLAIVSTAAPEKEKSASEMREQLVLMLEALASLQILLMQIDSKKCSMNADISKTLTSLASDNLEDVKKKVAEYQEQKRKAEEAAKASWWAKLVMTIVSCVISLVTLNPGLIITTCVMTTLEQSGAMEKIGDGISSICGDDKLLSFIVKLGVTLALCAAAGGASASCATGSAAKGGAFLVAASQVAGSFQEMGGLHDIIVYNVDQNHPTMSKEEKESKVAELEMIYGIVLTVVLTITAIAGGCFSCKSAADGSLGRIIQVVSLWANGVNVFANIAYAGANIKKAQILFDQADTYKALTSAQAEQQIYQQLSSFNSQMMEQSNSDLKKAVDQIGLMNQDQAKYVEGDKKLADLLSAMAM